MEKEGQHRRALALIAVSFVLWGLLRSLNDVLVPLFQSSMALSLTAAMCVHLSFFSAYLIVPLPAGILIQRWGYSKALTLAVVLMASGAMVLAFASALHAFTLSLWAVLLFALGISMLQTSANPAVTLLGPPESAARRLIALQGFTAAGSMLGPLIGMFLLPTSAATNVSWPFPTAKLITLYTLLGALLMLASALVLRLLRRDVVLRPPAQRHRYGMFLSKQVVAGLLAIFLYVGAETTVLSFLVQYLVMPVRGSSHARLAALSLSAYWAAVLAGRLLALPIMRTMDIKQVLRFASAGALALVGLTAVQGSALGGLALVLTGVFHAVMFPGIFTTSLAKLPAALVPGTSALLTMGIAGGAVLPVASAALAGRYGLGIGLALPAFSYVSVGFFTLLCGRE